MSIGRATLVCLALGTLTTIAIAWALALWPTSLDGGFTLSVPIDPDANTIDRAVYLVQEKRPGVRSFFVSTSATTPSTFEPSWSPLGGATVGTPLWTLAPRHRPAVLRVIAEFAALNADMQADQRPIPAWPRWLPDIPETPDGLFAFGGRAAGWPFVTMRSVMRVDADTRETTWSGSWRILPRGRYQGGPRFIQDPESGSIPLRPEPLGFALATAMWGAAWLVLLLTPSTLRRGLRRRRGGCVACGYDLRSLPDGSPCPECGAQSRDR